MHRWMALFGADDDWERENPPVSRRDWIFALGWWGLLAVSMELVRSLADMSGARPWWAQHLMIAVSCVPLVLRRWRPYLALVLGLVTFFVTLTWTPEVGAQVLYQATFFIGLFSVAAWGRDRQHLGLVVIGIAVGLAVWLGWDLAHGAGLDYWLRESRPATHGLLPVATAFALLSIINNVLYLSASLSLGQMAWAQARDRDCLARSAETIRAQAGVLRDQAVVEERLRIARELHDVVAHHVSVMGIQAGAARRLLQARPEQASQALVNVEDSAREAVAQMRGLLGALRAHEPSTDEVRGPQPTLAELPELVGSFAPLQVSLTTVERAPELAARVPLPLQLSLYRIVQEALANVVQHSTAHTASVVVREGPGFVEAEVLDDGRPRGGTSGTGMGLVGIRERIASHHGTSDIGPRVTGGYRVRVRFPLEDAR